MSDVMMSDLLYSKSVSIKCLMSDVMMADLPYSKSVSISNLPVCEFLNSRTSEPRTYYRRISRIQPLPARLLTEKAPL